ncbi:hypothetical protein NDU88_010271 [Pleurodeles waltl]|uniref:Uncharacterized protein n=1 Tax=Pleurodeles waltl TaxID=8319 RepID=A0AAV7QTX9_PLEWA|nr:hypothetical protein NDU88_010271 [Pleurodeles waltl]
MIRPEKSVRRDEEQEKIVMQKKTDEEQEETKTQSKRRDDEREETETQRERTDEEQVETEERREKLEAESEDTEGRRDDAVRSPREEDMVQRPSHVPGGMWLSKVCSILVKRH